MLKVETKKSERVGKDTPDVPIAKLTCLSVLRSKGGGPKK